MRALAAVAMAAMLVLTLGLAIGLSTGVDAAPGDTVRVSVSSSGAEADGITSIKTAVRDDRSLSASCYQRSNVDNPPRLLCNRHRDKKTGTRRP